MSDIIVGRNPVLEALTAQQSIDKVYLLHGQRGPIIHKIISLARQQKVQVVTLDKDRFARLSDSKNAQGVAARIEIYAYRELSEILDVARQRNEAPLIALLDGIEDPHNLGAIIRSAECAGVHGIVIPQHRSAGLTEIVAKTSAGALAHLAIAKVTNLVHAIEELKDAGVWIAGTAREAKQELYQSDLTGPLGIVIGSEGKGIRRLVKEKCDFLIRIPVIGKISSLNASVAAGVVFYEVVRQRLRTEKSK